MTAPASSPRATRIHSLDAATDWILSEIPDGADIVTMRAHAQREATRPRDSVHADWARTFLECTEEYVRNATT